MATTSKANRFLVSVCDVYARVPVTKEGIFAGRSNISTTFTLAMTATDVRGGDGNVLLMKYMHDRVLTVEITSATFQKQFLVLNTGSDITTGANIQAGATECVTFKAGVGTMTGTAVGKVGVFFEDGSCETVTPTAKAITLKDTTFNGIATLFYDTMVVAGASQLSVDTRLAPKVIDLTLIANVKDADGVIVEKMNINIPRYQVEGNYDLSFSADGVSQDKITGSALSVSGIDCTQGDTYAIITWIPVVTAP